MKKIGILLPIFSLPNKYGIGTLGKSAYRFIDFLNIAHIDYWQILPTNPTGYGDSPYQSFSTFAQNPYFIDLEELVKDKLLTKNDLKNSNLANASSFIDYGNIFVNKMKLLRKAYLKHDLFKDEFDFFKKDNNSWLFDFAIYMALKEKNNYASWLNFKDEYKNHDKEAINEFYKDNKGDVEIIMFMQFLYFKQWQKLIKYAHLKNIKIIGDMPIYVSLDSADVWANKDEFMLGLDYYPTLVAGVPPDYFSKTGQLWGNPLYNYEVMEKNNYSWWVKRIANALNYVDYLRIDHFRGFSAFYAIPFGSSDATNGKWIKGPGIKLFDVIKEKLNNPNIIAENLGLLDDDVNKLIKDTNYPGMRILEFECYSKENLDNLKKESSNNIMYPGTHDNNTFIGWFNENASRIEKENLLNELNYQKGDDLTEDLLKYCYKFPFDTVIILMQDILGLNSKARLNFPGKESGNWSFKFDKSDFNFKLAFKLRKLKKQTNLKNK